MASPQLTSTLVSLPCRCPLARLTMDLDAKSCLLSMLALRTAGFPIGKNYCSSPGSLSWLFRQHLRSWAKSWNQCSNEVCLGLSQLCYFTTISVKISCTRDDFWCLEDSYCDLLRFERECKGNRSGNNSGWHIWRRTRRWLVQGRVVRSLSAS